MLVDCVVCNGTNSIVSDDDGNVVKCPGCDGKGVHEITQCPAELMTQEVMEMIELAGLYKKGLPPVSGGALDQTKSFISACSFIWNEQQYCKNKLGILDWE